MTRDAYTDGLFNIFTATIEMVHAVVGHVLDTAVKDQEIEAPLADALMLRTKTMVIDIVGKAFRRDEPTAELIPA